MTIAHYIAERLLGADQISDHSLMIVRPDNKGTIGIEWSRHITHFLKLKSVINQSISRVVIIENAHALTIEAQQALLKTLEEPSPHTCIILTIAHKAALLPTLYSRLTTIALRQPSPDDIVTHYKKSFQRKDIDKALLISDARIGLMDALLQQTDHPLLQSIEIAKSFIRSSTFERLTKVDELSKQNFSQVLDALTIICNAGLKSAVSSSNQAQSKRWFDIKTTVLDTKISNRHNPNVRLLLTNLALAL